MRLSSNEDYIERYLSSKINVIFIMRQYINKARIKSLEIASMKNVKLTHNINRLSEVI